MSDSVDSEWKPETNSKIIIKRKMDHKYPTRSRDKKQVTKYDNDFESDTYSSDEDYQDEEDICITISKKKKTTNSPLPCLTSPFQNSELECIPFRISNFDDLLKLTKLCVEEKKMFKDCQKLPNILSILEEINSLIGLTSVKNALCNMILYELQSNEIYKNRPDSEERYWRHMVITGPPGTGKTMIAKIIARLLNRLGKSNSEEIVVGNQRNMISDWQGQTKTMVDDLVQSALKKSGIIFIDEAPSLNDGRDRASPDSYSKACLDTLMELMDEHKDKLIVILAGYQKEMEDNIMVVNKGFRRRIQWWFHIEKYSPDEMFSIFKKHVIDTGYTLPTNLIINADWFYNHQDFFPFYGGSIRNFIEKICTIHVKKTFGQFDKKCLVNTTITEGYELYKEFSLDSSLKESPTIGPMNENDLNPMNDYQFNLFEIPFAENE
jgi:type II secretory pathway predicted ATPase ExeA